MLPAVTAPPKALSQFVLKVHGRCDLSCDHCYVYEHADQSWRRKSRAMSARTVRVTAGRIAEHAQAHRLSRVRVVLHGGEPLLLGPARMREVLAELTATIAPVTRLDLVMQSNGVRLDSRMCDLLKEYAVRVGISLDGDREANDRHRRDAGGASSFDQVRRALRLLRGPAYREIYAGILCTIDVSNDPVRVYEALVAELPPRVDFLLPHATWADPPARPAGSPTPYAAWLGAIHERWLADGRPMRVRIFEALRSTAEGGPSGSEQLGTDPADLVVVDTDGQWEQADSTKTAYDGAPDTGMTVFDHSVDDVARYTPIALRQTGVAGLSETCRACPVVTRCGGGLYAHRYSADRGFDNPTVYCEDMKALIADIDRRDTARAAGTNAVDVRAAAERVGARAVDVKPETEVLLPVDLVDQIAGGFGDEPTMRWLVESQLSITRGLLSGLVDATGPADAWRLLDDVESRAPQAVRAVLSHPFVRVWAVRSLRGQGIGPAYLGEVAGAAAIRAGIAAETEVTVRDGGVHLPTLGTVRWPGGDGPARLVVEPGGFRLTAGGRTLTVALRGVLDAGPHGTRGAGPHGAPDGATVVEVDGVPAGERWRPVHRVDLDGLSILLDDGDPGRACHGWTPADPLGAAEVAAWRRDLAAAWDLIRAEVPGYVTGLRAGLRAVVPLLPDPDGASRASTARDAFGSVAAAHTDPADLAVILVHEFQHGKLGALLDIFDLFDPGSPVRIKVGWRPDPRPVEGVLQGIYAHAAVADVWRVRAGRGGGPAAAQNYARYLDWTAGAVTELRASNALTPLGRQFVDRLDAAMAGWGR